MRAEQQHFSPVSHQPETGEKNTRMFLSDNRSSSLAQAKMLQVIQRAGEGGTYFQTDKSDAHHMPSARAIAAIIVGNQQKNLHAANPAMPDMSMNAGDYRTLDVNNIYRCAPAVWMLHDAHKQTRTYGGNSTGALNADLPIIAGKSVDDAFDQIQREDITDCNRLIANPATPVANAITTTGLGMIGAASSAIKVDINSAITSGREVMANKHLGDTRMVPATTVSDDLKNLYLQCGTWPEVEVQMKAAIAASSVGSQVPEGVTASGLGRIYNDVFYFKDYSRQIHANTAQAIRLTVDYLT